MDRTSVKILNEYKDKHKKIIVEICNDFGQIGFVEGYLSNNINYSIVNDFYLDIVSSSKKRIQLNIALENYKVNTSNSFYALKIRDFENSKLIYSNSYRKVFLLSNLHNFNPTDKDVDNWKKDIIVKTLLKKVGQYVKMEGQDYFTEGILQAIYLTKKSKNTMVRLIKNNGLETINLSNKKDVKVLNNKTCNKIEMCK